MDNKAFITVSGADMDPKQAPVQEVVTRVKMPLLVVGNRTGMWPHVAGAVDDDDYVYGEDGDGGDGEDDYSKEGTWLRLQFAGIGVKSGSKTLRFAANRFCRWAPVCSD